MLALAGAAVAYVSWRSADQLVHPARQAPGWTPLDLGLPYENVSFASDEGAIVLAGWWMPTDAPRGVVIFLHGYGDSKNQSLGVAPFLHDAGYSVLALDFRAHGASGGTHTTVGLEEVHDVLGAIRYARSREPAAEDLALIGYSMGGAAALNAAAVSDDVDAVIADSAFATLENIASNSITHFTDLPRYPFGPLSVAFAGWMVHTDVGENAPVRAIADANAPVLVIQGLADDIAIPAEDGEALAAAAPPGSQLWLVPGAAHVQAREVAPGEYEARVLSFLDATLSA